MILQENVTLYDTLDISSDASPQEIRDAYIRIKSTYNRDSVVLYTLISPEEREETLKKVEIAYAILSDSEKRREYDQNHGLFIDSENPFLAKKPLDSTNIVSIDRVPPMDQMSEENLLIPPATDFAPNLGGEVVGSSDPQDWKNPSGDHAAHAPAPPPVPAVPTPPPRPSMKYLKEPSRDPNHLLPPKELREKPAFAHQSPFDTRSFLPKLNPRLIQAIEMETEWRGSFLRQVREAYKISIEEMAAVTKVTKSYLTAIEDENYAKLPAPVYIRGFVLQVARVLKLPHEKVAASYLKRYRSKQ